MTTATATIDWIEPGVKPDPARNAQALEIVKKWSLWSMAPGVFPFPFLDLAAIAAIQMKMIGEISNLYGIRFSEHKFKNVFASLLGSFGTGIAGTGVAYSLIKTVPIIGQAAGILALPAVAAASTYALGRIFTVHFSSGGTFLSLDPDKVRDHFQHLYQENLTENLKKTQDKKEAAK